MTLLPRITAAIFDVDGTLVDSRDLHIACWKQAFAEAGFDISEVALQAQMGRRKGEIVTTLLISEAGLHPDEELQRQIIQRKAFLYLEQAQDVRALPFATEIVQLMHSRGIKIAFATSANRIEVSHHIHVLEVEGMLTGVLSSEDVTESKPHPEIVLRALQRLETKADQAIMIGDSPHDMYAARGAGVAAIGVLTGGYHRWELRKSGAQWIYGSLRELATDLHLINKTQGPVS